MQPSVFEVPHAPLRCCNVLEQGSTLCSGELRTEHQQGAEDCGHQKSDEPDEFQLQIGHFRTCEKDGIGCQSGERDPLSQQERRQCKAHGFQKTHAPTAVRVPRQDSQFDARYLPQEARPGRVRYQIAFEELRHRRAHAQVDDQPGNDQQR